MAKTALSEISDNAIWVRQSKMALSEISDNAICLRQSQTCGTISSNLYRAEQKIVKTPTQRQLNNNSMKVGFDMKMTLQIHPTTTTHRVQPNPNDSAESEYIRNRIVPFLINRKGFRTIRIRFSYKPNRDLQYLGYT